MSKYSMSIDSLWFPQTPTLFSRVKMFKLSSCTPRAQKSLLNFMKIGFMCCHQRLFFYSTLNVVQMFHGSNFSVRLEFKV